MSQNPCVAVVQASCGADTKKNIQSAIQSIRSAADSGANIVCLQELFNTLYLCQEEDHKNFDLAEPIPGPTTDALSSIASEKQIVIVAGLFERRAAGLFHNSAIVIDTDGSIVGHYRKMHIPDDPHYYEKFYFTPGDAPRHAPANLSADSSSHPAAHSVCGSPNGFQSFSTAYGRIGVCICWDQWFPEAARLTAMTGAQLIVYPTAIGWLAEDKQDYGSSQLAAWTTMLRSHAIANGVFVVAPNRVGNEGNIEFWGNSLMFDPYGNSLASGDVAKEETITAECDWSVIETARTHWPFLRDRRIDAYDGLLKRWSQ